MNTLTNLAGAALVSAILFAGCATRSADLTPVDLDRTGPRGGEVTMTEVDGVRLEVAADAWPGSRVVAARTTPLQMTLANHSDHRIEVRYEDINLIGENGERYSALTPFQADPTPGTVVPLNAFHLRYRRFLPAPHVSAYYPFMRPFATPVYFDPLYWDRYYLGSWDGFEPEVGEVRLWAIPRGEKASDRPGSGHRDPRVQSDISGSF